MTYTPTVIKSLQRGALTIPAGSGSVSVTVAAINPAYASLRKLGAVLNSGGSADGFGGIYIASATTINAYRYAAGGNLVIDWELVEYLPIFVSRVQRGITTTTNVTSLAVAVAAYNPSRSQLHHLGNSTSDTTSGNFSNELTRVEVTSGSSITVFVGSTLYQQLTSWELVEYK